MKHPSGPQGLLFGPVPASRSVRQRRPPRQTTVLVTAEAIHAVTGGIDGAHIVAAAIRAARPEVRNIAVDLGTIRWTDPTAGHRLTFATPAVVRAALFAFAGGGAPAPFRFTLRLAARNSTIDQARPVDTGRR